MTALPWTPPQLMTALFLVVLHSATVPSSDPVNHVSGPVKQQDSSCPAPGLGRKIGPGRCCSPRHRTHIDTSSVG
jgi:hypothetical protein